MNVSGQVVSESVRKSFDHSLNQALAVVADRLCGLEGGILCWSPSVESG